MNSSASNVPRSSVSSIPFSIIILTGDPEAWEYNPFLSGILHGFMILWMAETTFKTAASLFFIWDWCSFWCLRSLGTSGSSNKTNISSASS